MSAQRTLPSPLSIKRLGQHVHGAPGKGRQQGRRFAEACSAAARIVPSPPSTISTWAASAGLGPASRRSPRAPRRRRALLRGRRRRRMRFTSASAVGVQLPLAWLSTADTRPLSRLCSAGVVVSAIRVSPFASGPRPRAITFAVLFKLGRAIRGQGMTPRPGRPLIRCHLLEQISAMCGNSTKFRPICRFSFGASIIVWLVNFCKM